MTDYELSEPQKVRAAGNILAALKTLSTNPDAKSAPEDHMSVATAGSTAYKSSKDQLCKEGNDAWKKASDNLFNEFSRVAAITDPYIERRQEKDLRDQIKILANDGQKLNDHCARPTSSDTSSPKI